MLQNPPANAQDLRDTGLIRKVRKVPWKGNDNPLQYSCLGRKVRGQEGPLEKEMTTHCSILAWEIPWTEEPGGLQSTGLQRADKTAVT